MNFDTLFELAPQAVKQKLIDNKGLRENPIWHSEENAFEHIKIVTNRLSQLNDINLTIAGFFHDICKMESATPRENSPWFLCKDHEKKAVAFTLRHVNFIHSFEGTDLGKILWIIDNHMRVKNLKDMKGNKRKEIENNKWIDSLIVFSYADNMNFNWEENLEKTKQIKLS